MEFQVPAFRVTLFTAPSPFDSVPPKSTYGQIATSPTFWRMPRKLYRLGTSTAPVVTTCAEAFPARDATITIAEMTDQPKQLTERIDIQTPPCECGGTRR